MRSHELVTAPSVELAGLSDAQQWIPVEPGVDEDVVTFLLEACREVLETYLGRAFINQTWKLTLDSREIEEASWVGSEQLVSIISADSVITLPRPPLSSVTLVETYDTGDAKTTVSTSVYEQDTGEASRIFLKSGQTWGSLRARKAMVVTYVAGYGDQAEDVPARFRRVHRMLVVHAYRYRGQGVIPDINGMRDDPEMQGILDLVAGDVVPYL